MNNLALIQKDANNFLEKILKQSVPSQYLLDGGYTSFSQNCVDGIHYYIQDYMGNNRMVVNGQTGATEQVTHYYPYGGVIGDISTNQNLQTYKFEGKVLAAIEKIDNLRREDEPLGEGKDHTFGLDWNDIHARQYNSETPNAKILHGLPEDQETRNNSNGHLYKTEDVTTRKRIAEYEK